MRPLSVPELLGVWERALAAHPSERALAILSAACPECSPAVLARVSIGRRDVGLLTVREWAFGPELAVLADCPQCHQSLETMLRTDDLRAPGETPVDEESSMTSGGYALRCRPPNTTDLLACAGQDPEAIRRRLFACCVIEALRDDEPVSAEDLPEEIMHGAIERIAASDPQADMRIDLTCPECRHGWSETFDIASFFWTEIDAWAQRLLRDVNALARAYGWREQDILALSPTRRQMYLAMAQA
jgi:hypothetical protein